MQPRFPKEWVKWRQEVERRLLQNRLDIDRLWRRTPQAFRTTDGVLLSNPFPIQVVPDPVTGSQTGIAQTGTDDTLGLAPIGCGPCGAAQWRWSAGSSAWVLIANQCDAGCNPVTPAAVGTFDGQQRWTCCEESVTGSPLSGVGTGTPIIGSGSPGCGTSTWQWDGTDWTKIADNCTCADATEPDRDGAFVGETVVTLCE